MLKSKLRWTFLSDMLEDEYKQSLSEGKDVSEYKDEVEKILLMKDGREKEELAGKIISLLEEITVNKDFEYIEPSDYKEIKKLLPENHEDTYQTVNKSYEEALKGAWYGRAIGCLLGIPVEGWTRAKIKDYLKASGQFPLSMYISSSQDSDIRKDYDVYEDDKSTPYDRVNICWYNCVGSFPIDDDINYTIIALKVIERYGRCFTSEDVAEVWLLGIPGLHACTAERAAYRNLMNGILPPYSATVKNPYREYIGAQIRADLFGYINPGNPYMAAQMAFKDASISHTKNGIYGEMFVAALLSLSYVEGMSMYERINKALDQIPPTSRLYKEVKRVCDEYKRGLSYEEVINNIHTSYDETQFFYWCLTIPNTMIVVASLLFYEGDFDLAITNTVLCGFDTDCNSATVGSILGLRHGFSSINEKWYKDLQPTLSSSVNGYNLMTLDEAVNRTIKLIEFE